MGLAPCLSLFWGERAGRGSRSTSPGGVAGRTLGSAALGAPLCPVWFPGAVSQLGVEVLPPVAADPDPLLLAVPGAPVAPPVRRRGGSGVVKTSDRVPILLGVWLPTTIQTNAKFLAASCFLFLRKTEVSAWSGRRVADGAWENGRGAGQGEMVPERQVRVSLLFLNLRGLRHPWKVTCQLVVDSSLG